MTERKERLTVTVDPEVVEAGRRAVAEGRADSLSSWVNEALAARAEHDEGMAALRAALDEYQAEFGWFTDEELEAQRRADREAAIVIRGGKTVRDPRRKPGKRGAA